MEEDIFLRKIAVEVQKKQLKIQRKELYCSIMKKRDILLITDSHLIEHCPERAAFRFLLEKISGSDYDVLFLGDIFDIWIGCRGYETTVHREFMDWCSQEKGKRNLWYLEGNHEFFIHRNRSQYFTEVFPDHAVLDDGALFVSHGDTVNYHDKAFAFLRGSLRNPFSYFLMKLFGYTGLGTSFSGKVRKDLRGTNQKQKHYFPEKELEELSEDLLAHGVVSAAVGHFHRSGKVGSITILQNFSADDYVVGLYQSGKGLRPVPLREIFGEWQ